MRIATWNVNSLKARLEKVTWWLDRAKPDVLLMQETKLTDADAPANVFKNVLHGAFLAPKLDMIRLRGPVRGFKAQMWEGEDAAEREGDRVDVSLTGALLFDANGERVAA